MTIKLFVSAVSKFLLGVLLVGVLIFWPSGTLCFFNGWLLMSVLFVPMTAVGVLLMLTDPALLKKRLDAKEKQADQGLVVKLSGLMFVAGFVVAGLGERFGWYRVPQWVSLLFAGVFLLGYLLYALVLKQNTYLSRVIEVQQGQKVIDTGVYAVVRHPMYSATLLLFLSLPLILGSLYALAVFLPYPLLIAKRIKGEEALLEQQLEGYAAYKQRVRYRLIPFIW